MCQTIIMTDCSTCICQPAETPSLRERTQRSAGWHPAMPVPHWRTAVWHMITVPKELEPSQLSSRFTSKKKGAHEVIPWQHVTNRGQRRTLMHLKGLVARKDCDSDCDHLPHRSILLLLCDCLYIRVNLNVAAPLNSLFMVLTQAKVTKTCIK